MTASYSGGLPAANSPKLASRKSPSLSFSISSLPTFSSANRLAPSPAISFVRPQKPSRANAQPAFPRADGRRLQLRAGLDAELFGEPALVRRQREVGGDEPGLALAQDLEQVELRQRVRFGQRAVALFVQFDRDRVVVAAGDFGLHRLDARARDVRGAEQRVMHAIAFDEQVRLVVQGARGARCGDVQSRYRFSRSW